MPAFPVLAVQNSLRSDKDGIVLVSMEEQRMLRRNEMKKMRRQEKRNPVYFPNMGESANFDTLSHVREVHGVLSGP